MARTRSATPLEPVSKAQVGDRTYVWVRRNIRQVEVASDGVTQVMWEADEVSGIAPDGISDQNALWNLLATGERTVAEGNVPKGEVFRCGGVYYRALAAIPRGEEVIEGSNATPIDVAAVLNQLETKE